MAQIWTKPEIKLKIALELNEEEARALLIICEIGTENLIELLYGYIGVELINEHKKGIVSLFNTAKQPLSAWIDKVEIARKIFEVE